MADSIERSNQSPASAGCRVVVGAGELRAIAVAADADPRTVREVLRGRRAKGMVDARIRRVLTAQGIKPPEPAQSDAPHRAA